MNRFVKRLQLFALVAVCALCASPVFAQGGGEGPTLPDTGVDVAEYIELAVSGMGAVIAVAVGGFIAVSIIKRGIRWIRTAMG